jgi:hypothetical protein
MSGSNAVPGWTWTATVTVPACTPRGANSAWSEKASAQGRLAHREGRGRRPRRGLEREAAAREQDRAPTLGQHPGQHRARRRESARRVDAHVFDQVGGIEG